MGRDKLTVHRYTRLDTAVSYQLAARGRLVMSIVDILKSRIGKPVLLHIRPPKNRFHDESGRCNVCGASGRFVFNSWVLSDAQFSELGPTAERAWKAYARRESLFCVLCGSSLRVRQMADELLAFYGDGASQSVSQLVQQEPFRALDIAEINTIGALGSPNW